jgi:large subunit ribosomal protein L4
MNVDILNKDGAVKESISVGAEFLDGSVNEPAICEAVKMQLACRRKGTASTKTRAFVSGGGVKPWKQKGTGRARSGSNRSPVWRHGGTVFGPHPRDYSYRIPKQVSRIALASAINLRLREGGVKVIDSVDLKGPKTRVVSGMLAKAGITNALLVYDKGSRDLSVSTRNIRSCKAVEAAGINVYDILKYKNLVFTRPAFDGIRARFAEQKG